MFGMSNIGGASRTPPVTAARVSFFFFFAFLS
jgi:hypothetical protein